MNSNSTFIVAEIGNNHEGSLRAAIRLLEAAVESGADAVKFQAIIPDSLIAQSETVRLQQLRRFALSREDLELLFQMGRDLGVVCFATPFDCETAFWLNSHQELFKIASGDNDYWPLIAQVASFGKPTMISTGMANEELVSDLISQWLRSSPKGLNNLTLLHCVSAYPVPVSDVNLQAIMTLQDSYPGVRIGYSDHALGINAAVFAAVLGATVIEKHFTLSHDASDFRDHALSATPDEFQQMVRLIRCYEEMSGSGSIEVAPSEQINMIPARRGAVARRSLRLGESLREDDLEYLRPRSGLSPGEVAERLGLKVVRPVNAGQSVKHHDVDRRNSGQLN